MTRFQARRVYDEVDADDGFRVLVDRLWPRGVSKERAALDLWARDVAPSHELRRWYHEDVEARKPAFRERYLAELDASGEVERLREALAGHPVVTFLTATRDPADLKIPTILEALGETLG